MFYAYKYYIHPLDKYTLYISIHYIHTLTEWTSSRADPLYSQSPLTQSGTVRAVARNRSYTAPLNYAIISSPSRPRDKLLLAVLLFYYHLLAVEIDKTY